MRTVVTNATVLDTGSMTFDEGRTVVIADGMIVDVASSTSGDADLTIDANGAFVVPASSTATSISVWPRSTSAPSPAGPRSSSASR